MTVIRPTTMFPMFAPTTAFPPPPTTTSDGTRRRAVEPGVLMIILRPVDLLSTRVEAVDPFISGRSILRIRRTRYLSPDEPNEKTSNELNDVNAALYVLCIWKE